MIEFNLNGQTVQVANEQSMVRLLDIIRQTPIQKAKDEEEQEYFTGTKEGCGEGECGACSVLVDGQLVNSCLVPILQMDGKNVRTVEGIVGNFSDDMNEANQIVDSFLKKGGAQCGICTPGMVVATKALIEKKKRENFSEISRADIQNALAGNLCRCTGYQKIIDSVKECIDLFGSNTKQN